MKEGFLNVNVNSAACEESVTLTIVLLICINCGIQFDRQLWKVFENVLIFPSQRYRCYINMINSHQTSQKMNTNQNQNLYGYLNQESTSRMLRHEKG